jgi:hypothetical protein
VPQILSPRRPRIQDRSRGYDGNLIRRTVRNEPAGTNRNDTAIVEVRAMKRIRIEKPKPRRPMEIDLPLPLDPRDPDIVRVKRGPVWRFADRRWAV